VVAGFDSRRAYVDDLIEALTIMRKYANPKFPTNCSHDLLYVNVDPELVSREDLDRLSVLGFRPDTEYASKGFVSFLFGSC
jgi:hypothetical protein